MVKSIHLAYMYNANGFNKLLDVDPRIGRGGVDPRGSGYMDPKRKSMLNICYWDAALL